jgi:hypothetical protein
LDSYLCILYVVIRRNLMQFFFSFDDAFWW